VPVHADIPHQEVIFLDEVDATMSPLKAKGVGELGHSGAAAAVANAVYNATGARVRDYPDYAGQVPRSPATGHLVCGLDPFLDLDDCFKIEESANSERADRAAVIHETCVFEIAACKFSFQFVPCRHK
jgi:hypothetical protein